MVLHNPNNWHWVNKDASAWAKSYFDEHLIGVTATSSDGTSVVVEKVLNIDGDVDVSQRKGKVITLFDVKIQLEYTGKTSTNEDVGGTITIPEAAHDTEVDEYVFEIAIYSETKEKQPVKDLIRAEIVPKLRQLVHAFAGDLVATHGKDIQHTRDTDPKYNSGVSTPVGGLATTPSGTASPALKPSGNSQAGKNASHVNTTTLNKTFEFQTTAQELNTTLVDPARVAAFTRAPPQVFEPKIGGKFKLFGGNVEGSFLTLDEPDKIIQAWRLSDWPSEHFSALQIVFDQGDGITTLRLSWKGIPVGKDDVALRNFEEYYIRSIKLTFGFGAIL